MDYKQRIKLAVAAFTGRLPVPSQQPGPGHAPRRRRSMAGAHLERAASVFRRERGHAADSFESPGSGIGVRGRDRAAHHRVTRPQALTREDCAHLWESSRIVKRAVAKRAAVALSREVQFAIKSGDTAYLTQEMKRLDALLHGLQGRTWGNLFGGALVLAHVDGESDPRLPLDLVGLRSVVRLEVVDRWDVRQVEHVQMGADGKESLVSYAGAGSPLRYHLSPQVGGQTWHASRVFRFDGDLLSRRSFVTNRHWHASKLVAMMEALSRYGIGIKALATQIEDANVGVWSIQGWNSMVSADDGDEVGEWLDNQLLFRSILGDYACDAEMDSFEFKGRPLKDSVEVFRQVKEDLAASVDMPAVELFGTSPAGLSTDDKGARKKWHTDIDSFERPVFARFFSWLLPMLQAQQGAPGELAGGSAVSIVWPSLETLSALEEEERREKRSQEAERLIKAGVVKPSEARRRLREDPTWELDEDEEVSASLSPLERLRQGRLVAGGGLLHREEEEANMFRAILGMDPWSPQARERLLEAMEVGFGGGGSGGNLATDSADADALLGQGLRLLGQVGQACDAVTGDGSKVGLFIPLPPDLAALRPPLSQDTSAPHVTLLVVGDVRGREEEFLALVEEVAREHPPECRATLSGVSTLVSRSGQLVVYQNVAVETGSPRVWSNPLEAFREALVTRLRQRAFPIADVSPDSWLPHLTLAYLEDPRGTWMGQALHGSWHVSGVEVWGLEMVVAVAGDGLMGSAIDQAPVAEQALATALRVRAEHLKLLGDHPTSSQVMSHYHLRFSEAEDRKEAERLARLFAGEVGRREGLTAEAVAQVARQRTEGLLGELMALPQDLISILEHEGSGT